MTKPSFSLRLPALTTKEVWIGFYSDMTGTVAMIFSGRPTKDRTLGCYGVDDERYVGSIWADDFAFWFGDLQPFIDAGMIERRNDLSCSWYCTIGGLDCQNVIPIDLTAAWNEDGSLIGLNTNADN